MPDGDPTALKGLGRLENLRTFAVSHREGKPGPSLQRVLLMTRNAEQEKPEDKVYGILSLVDPGVANLITPDYTLPKQAIYTDFAMAIIKSTGGLNIICANGISDSSEQLLPSWVPDWMEAPVVHWEMDPQLPYRTSRDATAAVHFKDQTLIAKGFVIDSIDGLRIYITDGLDVKNRDPANEMFQPLGKENPYGDEASRRDALWRTMIMNREFAGTMAPETYSGLLNEPWRDVDYYKDHHKLDCGPAGWYFDLIRLINQDLKLGGYRFRQYFPSEKGTASTMPARIAGLPFFQQIMSAWLGRRIIVTAKGYFGLARVAIRRGDIVCILLGCSVPVILRLQADGTSYKLVSDAYIHGICEGEAMDWLEAGDHRLEDLSIV